MPTLQPSYAFLQLPCIPCVGVNFCGEFLKHVGVHLTPTYTPMVVKMFDLPFFLSRLAQFLT